MPATSWTIDTTHSAVSFKVRHMMISKVRGTFGTWQASLAYDPSSPTTARISASLDTTSIQTGVADRDAHLRSADFFNVEEFPKMTFESQSIEPKGDDLLVHGDLTIRGATRPVTLKVERTGEGKDPWGNHRAAFAAHTRLSRKDFGLTYNAALEAGGVLVGDEVEIEIEIEAIRAPA